MIDFKSILYGPNYAAQGVEASIVLISGEEFAQFKVIDKTAGKTIYGKAGRVQTILPACTIQIAELTAAGLAVADLPGKAKITFNGVEWGVVSYRLRPSPSGEADGEAFLILSSPEEASEVPSSGIPIRVTFDSSVVTFDATDITMDAG